MPVLPPLRFGRRVGKAFQLAQRLGEMRGVVLGIDDRVAPAVIDDQAGRKLVVAETAAALPIHCLADAALVFTVDDLLQARNDMSVAVVSQFDHDPAAAHFVRDCAGGAGTGEGVKDEVVGVGGDVQVHALADVRALAYQMHLPCQIAHGFLSLTHLYVQPPRVATTFTAPTLQFLKIAI